MFWRRRFARNCCLCGCFSWRLSSDMPDIYISRAGMENKDLDLKFTNTELGWPEPGPCLPDPVWPRPGRGSGPCWAAIPARLTFSTPSVRACFHHATKQNVRY